jgi:hypothetical protein
MTKQIPLSDKRKTDKQVENILEFYWYAEEDVKKKVRNVQLDLMEELSNWNYTNEVKAKIINKIFKKHFGERLLK